MSKIKAVDFAKYVEDNRKLGIDILSSKNVNVKRTDSLSKTISKIAELPSKTNGSISPDTDKYIPDPYFVKMEQDYLNDILRIENGGNYVGCNYIVLKAYYDTTFISGQYGLKGASSTKPIYIITSDNQEFTITSANDLTITWDKTKDIDTLEDGTIVRWIKIYKSVKQPSAYPCYDTNKALDYRGMVLMVIDDYREGLDGGVSSSGAHLGTYGFTHIKYAVLTESVTRLNACLIGCYRLECIKHLGNELTLSSIGNINNGNPTNYKIEANIIGVSDSALTFGSGDLVFLEHILPNLDLLNISINHSGGYPMFRGIYSSKDIVFPETVERLNGGVSIVNPNQTTLVMPNENSPTTGRWDIYGRSLQIISIPQSISRSIYLRTPRLFKNSLINIFYNLKDLTGEKSSTITCPKMLESSFTLEELAIATNKNWTVTFA